MTLFRTGHEHFYYCVVFICNEYGGPWWSPLLDSTEVLMLFNVAFAIFEIKKEPY